MRADLLVGGLFLLVVGIVLDVTLIGAILGLPIGAIGVVMMIAGFFMGGGGGKGQTKGQQSSDEKQRRYQRYQAEQYNRHRRQIESQERSKKKQ